MTDSATEPGSAPAGTTSTRPRTDLAARYGRPAPGRRWALVAAVAVLAAAGLGWLLWVAIEHSTPPVTSQLRSFQIESASVASAVIEVRRAEDESATCRVQAKASDFSIVGEATVAVPATSPREQVLDVEIRTQRTATSVVLIGCTTPTWQRPN